MSESTSAGSAEVGRPPKVVVADDDPTNLRMLKSVLRTYGFDPILAETGAEAIAAVLANKPEAIILDMRMPGMSGLETLRKLRNLKIETPVLMLTAFGEVSLAVEAMRAGADDFLTRPIENSDLALALKRAIAAGRRDRTMRPASAAPGAGADVDLAGMMGTSAQIAQVTSEVRLVASTDMTTLLLGETGTGKEVVARAIHAASARRAARMVAVDCGAIPDNLMESELFGYERGAFSGADKRKEGLFELARGGTLFLDEIGNLSLPTQAKLLRVLQERSLLHLGGDRTIDIDCRIIAATNEHLMQRVVAGQFRADLFYRLAEFIVRLPSLRDRPTDIEPLTNRFVHEVSRELGRTPPRMSDGYLDALTQHSWPGNVRELRNLVRQTVLRAQGDLHGRDVSDLVPPGEPASDKAAGKAPHGAQGSSVAIHVLPDAADGATAPDASLKEIAEQASDAAERVAIVDALKQTGGNKSAAARLLRVDFKTLQSKIKRLGLGQRDDPNE